MTTRFHQGKGGLMKLANMLLSAATVLVAVSQLSGQVIPILHCVEPFNDGTYLAHFGYFNISLNVLNFTAGTALNQFIPLPSNRFQPTAFQPGVHPYAFSVPAPLGTDLTWIVNNQAAVARVDPNLICRTQSISIQPFELWLPAGMPSFGVPVAIVSDPLTPAGNLTIEPSAATVTNWNNGVGMVRAAVVNTPLAADTFTTIKITNPAGSIAVRSAVAHPVDCSTIADLGSQLSLTIGPLRPNVATQTWSQTVTITNTSGASIAGPVSLLPDAVSQNAVLSNASGVTGCRAMAPAGFVRFVASGSSFAPGQSVAVTLQFLNSDTRVPITWSTRIIGL